MASRLRLGLAKLLGSETPPPSPSPVEGRAARTPPPAVQHLAQPVGARLTNNAEWDGQAICQAAFDADAQAAVGAGHTMHIVHRSGCNRSLADPCKVVLQPGA